MLRLGEARHVLGALGAQLLSRPGSVCCVGPRGVRSRRGTRARARLPPAARRCLSDVHEPLVQRVRAQLRWEIADSRRENDGR